MGILGNWIKDQLDMIIGSKVAEEGLKFCEKLEDDQNKKIDRFFDKCPSGHSRLIIA